MRLQACILVKNLCIKPSVRFYERVSEAFILVRMRIRLAERTLSDTLLYVIRSPIAEVVHAPCCVCLEVFSNTLRRFVHLSPLYNHVLLIGSRSGNALRRCQSRSSESYLCCILIVLRCCLTIDNHLSLQLQW